MHYDQVASTQQYYELRFKQLEEQFRGLNNGLRDRIVNLEQQVANQAIETRRLKGELNPHLYPDPAAVKSQAAATQATEHLYAPLRSDTKPLLEMSAFVRKIADINRVSHNALQCKYLLADLVDQARDILKRST